MEASEVLELLARQAFQSFDIQLDHSARTFTSGKPSKAEDPVPAYLYDIPEFDSVPQYDQFKEQICQRANGGLNPELSIDAFQLGRQTISNAWYRLYNPRHTQIRSNYKQYSKTLKHPAVVISFFDAWVYCQWLRWDDQSCRLPWETEWEYAAKYGFASGDLEYWWEGIEHLEKADRMFIKSRINCFETTDRTPSNEEKGCTVVPDPARASSGSKALDRGPEGQNTGLMDMQGNTWEWCQDRQRSNYEAPAKASPFPQQEQQHRQESLARDATVSRVSRGGSFDNYGRIASASFRELNEPTNTFFNDGFRVARALKGKP